VLHLIERHKDTIVVDLIQQLHTCYHLANTLEYRAVREIIAPKSAALTDGSSVEPLTNGTSGDGSAVQSSADAGASANMETEATSSKSKRKGFKPKRRVDHDNTDDTMRVADMDTDQQLAPVASATSMTQPVVGMQANSASANMEAESASSMAATARPKVDPRVQDSVPDIAKEIVELRDRADTLRVSVLAMLSREC